MPNDDPRLIELLDELSRLGTEASTTERGDLDLLGTVDLVHAMSAEVAATKDQPKSAEPRTATGSRPGDASAAVETATRRVVRTQAHRAVSRLCRRAVRAVF